MESVFDHRVRWAKTKRATLATVPIPEVTVSLEDAIEATGGKGDKMRATRKARRNKT